MLGWALFYFLPPLSESHHGAGSMKTYMVQMSRDQGYGWMQAVPEHLPRRGVCLTVPWPHGGEPAPAPQLGDCGKETCLLEGSNSRKKPGSMLMCSLLVASVDAQ